MSFNINKKVVIGGFLFLAMSLSGCSSSNPIDSFSKKAFSEQESIEFISTIEEDVFERNTDILSIKKTMDDNINRIKNVELSSMLVNNYIYGLYSESEKYLSYIDLLGEDFSKIKESLKVDTFNEDIIPKIPDRYQIAKGFFEELDKRDLMMVEESDRYYIDVDMASILNQYKDYLNNDIKQYMEFKVEERNTEIYDANSDLYKIPELYKMADLSIKGLLNCKDVAQTENWKMSVMYFLDLITSISQDTFLEDNTDGYKIDSKRLEELKSEAKQYNGTDFGKFIDKYLEVLEQENLDPYTENINEFLQKLESSVISTNLLLDAE